MAPSSVSRCLLPVLLCAACASATDLKIVTSSKASVPGSLPSLTTRYYTQSRSRTEFRNSAVRQTSSAGRQITGPREAIIQQCDARRAYMLDLDAHEYTVTELSDHGHWKPGQPAQALPSKEGGSLEIYLDTEDTGDRKQMFGHTARHLITRERRMVSPESCGQNTNTETDGWYIDIEVPQGCDNVPGNKHSGIAILTAGPAGCLKNLQVHRTGVTDTGFAVQLKQTTHSFLTQPDGTKHQFTSTSETAVTELSEAPLDPKLFEVPAGFKQVSKLSTQPTVPAMVAIQMWWERLKRSIRGIFG